MEKEREREIERGRDGGKKGEWEGVRDSSMDIKKFAQSASSWLLSLQGIYCASQSSPPLQEIIFFQHAPGAGVGLRRANILKFSTLKDEFLHRLREFLAIKYGRFCTLWRYEEGLFRNRSFGRKLQFLNLRTHGHSSCTTSWAMAPSRPSWTLSATPTKPSYVRWTINFQRWLEIQPQLFLCAIPDRLKIQKVPWGVRGF